MIILLDTKKSQSREIICNKVLPWNQNGQQTNLFETSYYHVMYVNNTNKSIIVTLSDYMYCI